MPYSSHSFLAIHTLVNNCFQGWNTGRVKCHQKSDALAPLKQGQISSAMFLFFFSIMFEWKYTYNCFVAYIQHIIKLLYAAQDNSSSFSTAQARQQVGQPYHQPGCTSVHLVHSQALAVLSCQRLLKCYLRQIYQQIKSVNWEIINTWA